MWSAVHHVWSSALELMSCDELGHISFLCATVTMKQFVTPDDYSDCPSLRIPDCTEKGSESFWLSKCSHVDSSVNHLSTWALFSVTHLMLAAVFSIACSRASVAEPKPTWRLSSLNFFSWRDTENKEITEIVHGSSFFYSKHPQGDTVCISVRLWLWGQHTSCNSNSEENLLVIPWMRLEKENEAFPYLKTKKYCSVLT